MVARVLAIIAALVAAGGCEKRSTKYCANNPEDLANCEQTDAAIPPRTTCINDTECPGGHCDPDSGKCVECYDTTQCQVGEICDAPGTFTCRGCVKDSDCGGALCLPSGSCGDDNTVVYVDAAGTDSGTCDLTKPCQTLEYGLTLVDTKRNYVRLTGAHSGNVVITVPVDIVADGATWTVSSGVGIKINTAVVSVTGLTVTCTGDQDGFEIGMNSTATLDRVDISGCDHDAGIDLKMSFLKLLYSEIHDNPAGGIKTDGSSDFVIVNNFIHHNGGLTGFGISVGADKVRDEKLEFNTIVANGIGLTCGKAIVAPNNIISGNGMVLANNVVGCDASGSYVMPDTAPLMFNMPTGPNFDYHILSGSAAIGGATTPSTVMDDYDREIRDAAPDFGADEFRAIP